MDELIHHPTIVGLIWCILSQYTVEDTTAFTYYNSIGKKIPISHRHKTVGKGGLMRFRIGSFNVKNLSYDASGRDIDRIAGLIKDNGFDIVALQEVLSEGGILKGRNLKNVYGRARSYERSIIARLGPNWDCKWLNPETSSKYYPYLGDDNRGEGYAFIWRTDLFRLPRKDSENEVKPHVEHYYSIKGDNVIRLIRDPGIGMFRYLDRPVEIRLITTHIVYGKPKEENMSADLSIGAINMRRNEFNILAGQIYKKVKDFCKTIESQGTVATIILGDYNLNIGSSGIPYALIPEISYFDSEGRCFNPNIQCYESNAPIRIYTLQKDLSTLKLNNPGMANNFDHFSVDDNTMKLVVGSASVIDGVHQRTESTDNDEESKYNTYRKKVSDHLPIVIDIEC